MGTAKQPGIIVLADLRRDNGEVFLSRWPLVEVVHVAWFLHYVTGSVMEVSISFSLL